MADFLSVDSSWIAGIAHDPGNRKLSVQLKNGDVHHHYEFGADDFDQFVNAESIGSHYTRFIKARFPHIKQEPDTKKARPDEAAEPDVETARA